MASPTRSSITPPCTLLQKLPAELRYNIFELCFSNDKDTEINLLEAKPPSKALLLTCRQANSEARGLFEDAEPRFWITSSFVLDAHMWSGRGRDERMRHIHVKETVENPRRWYDYGEVTKIELIDPRGGWLSSRGPSDPEKTWLAAIPGEVAANRAGLFKL